MLKDFWDKNHIEKHQGHLSGCQYHETVDFLQVSEFIKPGINVLEVGIGLGFVTRGFYEKGVNIFAFDISEIALNRVSSFCSGTFLLSDLDKLPANFFDLIICHNVAQHVPTPELTIELHYFIRSLKSTGIFALESVSFRNKADTWNSKYTFSGILPCFCRSTKFMGSLINSVNGNCPVIVDNPVNFKRVSSCQVYHIQRKK